MAEVDDDDYADLIAGARVVHPVHGAGTVVTGELDVWPGQVEVDLDGPPARRVWLNCKALSTA